MRRHGAIQVIDRPENRLSNADQAGQERRRVGRNELLRQVTDGDHDIEPADTVGGHGDRRQREKHPGRERRDDRRQREAVLERERRVFLLPDDPGHHLDEHQARQDAENGPDQRRPERVGEPFIREHLDQVSSFGANGAHDPHLRRPGRCEHHEHEEYQEQPDDDRERPENGEEREEDVAE